MCKSAKSIFGKLSCLLEQLDIPFTNSNQNMDNNLLKAKRIAIIE